MSRTGPLRAAGRARALSSAMVLLIVLLPPVAAAATSGSGVIRDVTHVRWVITESRGETLIQAAELVLLEGDVPLPNLATEEAPGIVVADVDGWNPIGEEPDKAYDGDVETKWLDFNFSGDEAEDGSTLVIRFPAPVSFDGYHWVTANDQEPRDPISWRLEVSTDGETWTVVDTRVGVDVTEDRYAVVGPFTVAFPGSGGGGTGPFRAPSLACDPSPPSVLQTVTCTISGGDPGIVILWRAAYNPVIAEAGVTLDAEGRGTFAFTVPTAALGREVTVELVEWLAPVPLGVTGASTPRAVRAGAGTAPLLALLPLPLLALSLLGGSVLRRITTGSVQR